MSGCTVATEAGRAGNSFGVVSEPDAVLSKLSLERVNVSEGLVSGDLT